MKPNLSQGLLLALGVAITQLLLIGCNAAKAAPLEYGPRNLKISHVKPGNIPYLWASSPIRVTKSVVIDEGSRVIPGIPEQPIDAPVAVLSCSETLSKDYGQPNNVGTDHFTVYNRTAKRLLIAKVHFIFPTSPNMEVAIQDLAPHELRSITVNDNMIGQVLGYRLRKSHIPKPTHILCGAGPAVADDGTVYDFHALFLRDP